MKRRRDINLGATGCLCWETSTYSPDCCDPDDPKAEQIGRTRGPLTPPEPPPPEPSLGYGLLYNWYAATDVRGVAPDGWRVPTKSDFNTLSTGLGSNGSSITGNRRIDNTSVDPYWLGSPNPLPTNSTGFSAYPAGLRDGDGFGYQLFRSVFQIHATNDDIVSDYLEINGFSYSITIRFESNGKKFGRSIRCLRDTVPPSPTVTDADGNTYTWVQIGAQYWLAQSLKTTKYNTGDPIPTGLDDASWAATTEGAWAYPNGDPNLPI